MSTSKRVVVVGAGIGGLTAALALFKRGIDIQVYEQSSQLKEIGAGIQISSNGTRVLFALGLEAALAKGHVLPERRELRHSSTGETWNWFDLGHKSIERCSTPRLTLQRRLACMVGMNWLGPHGNVLNYPVRRGEIMNYVSTSERDDWQVESWFTAGTREELRNDFRDWHGDVQLMIDQIETPYKWAMMIRGRMAARAKGRVTLPGDAGHPPRPVLGQGRL